MIFASFWYLQSLLKSVKKEVTYLFGYIEPNEYKKMNVSLKWGNLKKKDNVDLLLVRIFF